MVKPRNEIKEELKSPSANNPIVQSKILVDNIKHAIHNIKTTVGSVADVPCSFLEKAEDIIKCPDVSDDNNQEHITGKIVTNPQTGKEECQCPTCKEAERIANENISMMSLPCKALHYLRNATCALKEYSNQYPMGTPLPITEDTSNEVKMKGGRELTANEWYHYFMDTNGKYGGYEIVKNKETGLNELRSKSKSI
jgi:hypothetical protein